MFDRHTSWFLAASRVICTLISFGQGRRFVYIFFHLSSSLAFRRYESICLYLICLSRSSKREGQSLLIDGMETKCLFTGSDSIREIVCLMCQAKQIWSRTQLASFLVVEWESKRNLAVFSLSLSVLWQSVRLAARAHFTSAHCSHMRTTIHSAAQLNCTLSSSIKYGFNVFFLLSWRLSGDCSDVSQEMSTSRSLFAIQLALSCSVSHVRSSLELDLGQLQVQIAERDELADCLRAISLDVE